jgi:SAM-dependent methyltransferase
MISDFDYSYDIECEESSSNPIIGGWLEGDSLAPPCQADMDCVYSILNLAHKHGGISPNDVVYDLGCGDGRICIEAARLFGCKAVGCEVESFLIERFRQNVQRRNLQERVLVVEGDLRNLDLGSASIIVLYLLPESIIEITGKLEACIRGGARVICNTWGPKGWVPVEKLACGPTNNVNVFIYDNTSL